MDTKYLDGTPDSFRKSCDVLLKLDDGSKLPAHALFLARYSKVFAAMLDDGPLSAASVLNKAELPLADCSKTAALSLLAVTYSNKESKNISKESSMAVASLAHRLDMQVCLINADASMTRCVLRGILERPSRRGRCYLILCDLRTLSTSPAGRCGAL